ncbi:AraC family transcriptional regulator [Lentzea sp.]|uniref:AraC family transcriptional regulator n=1 Tax=Lentzea sp. TaxID=56099 RepID=UPI002B5DA688|nr:AraC family transcriptional regulator [Lentzea sp.]HUQ56064.1 AraC family transcriptional regulator [Lentzea sp.]
MDLISEVIRAVRVGSANSRLIRHTGPGLRFSAFDGSGFHVITGGTCWLIGHDEPVPLRPGDIVLTTSGAEHGLSETPCGLYDLPLVEMGPHPPAPGPASFEFLCGAYRLEHQRPPQYLRALPELIAVSPDYDSHPELRSLVTLLTADATAAKPGSGATLRAVLDLILVQVLRQWHEQDEPGRPEVAHPGVAAALREIHEKPHHRWTVGGLSEVAGMPRAAFSRLFTTAVGQPPMTYVTGWRLSRAAQLLRETDASLARIAPRVGYSTEFALSAAFRREYGVSPGRFRATAP